MADSLVLVGVKDVRKHTGTEMQLKHPLRGGNTHQLKEWWRVNAVNTTYTACTVFKVTTAVGSVHLALATGSKEGPEVRIDHDGSFNFTFYHANELERAALFTDNMEIIEHYVFPSMSGGKIMTVTPAGAADRPTAGPPPAPDTTVDSASISGAAAPVTATTETYTAAATGDATPYTYSWTVTGGTIDSGAGTNSIDVIWGAAGSGEVGLEVGSTNANFDGVTQTDTLAVTIAVSFAASVASADATYVVTESGGNYYIDGVANDTITANAGETIHFDLSDASLSGHPFTLYTDATKTTAITVGVEQQGTDLLFTPPISGTFSYQCSDHAGMGGDIVIN